MANQDECDYCLNPANRIVRSPLYPRADALNLYVRLQSRGFLPSMCENHGGGYRVCFQDENRSGD